MLGYGRSIRAHNVVLIQSPCRECFAPTPETILPDMPNPYFPFHALGYQGNPFQAVTDDEWVALAILPDSIETVVNHPHLQILGDKGHGKTTTLLALAARFQKQNQVVAYEHLEIDQDHFITDLTGLDVFLLDEAQRLTKRERERLLGTRLRLVIASHEDLTPLFTRFGQPLTTVRFDTAPFAHVVAVVERRLVFFALPNVTARVTVSPDAIRFLHTTFGADVRQIEMALYEVFEMVKRWEVICEIGVEDVKSVL